MSAPLELCAYFPPCRIRHNILEIKGYNLNPQTFGAKLRNKRLELGLTIVAFAKLLQVTEETIIYWEYNRGLPLLYHYPKLIEIVGFLLFDVHTTTLGGKIKAYRYSKGLNRKKFGKMLNVDESTLKSWEVNKHIPMVQKFKITQLYLKTLI